MNRFHAFLINVMCLIFLACDSPPDFSQKIFSGSHKLRRIFNESNLKTKGNISGGFFVFVGAIEGSLQSSTERNVLFSWERGDVKNQYITTTLPLNLVQIRLDDSLKSPTVMFRWRTCHDRFCRSELDNGNINNFIYYAVINTPENLWKPIIKIGSELNEKNVEEP